MSTKSEQNQRVCAAIVAFHPKVRRYFARLIQCSDTVDELTQEVFVRLYDVVRRPDRTRTDIPWALVASIASKVTLEHWRQKQRGRHLTISTEYEHPSHVADDAYGMLERDELRRGVEGLIHELDPEEQEIVIGKHFLGLNAVELACILGKHRSTLLYCYRRAVERLRVLAKQRGILP